MVHEATVFDKSNSPLFLSFLFLLKW